MGTYKEIDGLRYTMEQLQNSGEKDQFPAGKGDLVGLLQHIKVFTLNAISSHSNNDVSFSFLRYSKAYRI